MSRPALRILLVFTGLVFAGLSGCGYAVGVGEFGAGARTIAVEIPRNRTFRQGIEVPLAREIQRALARHTDMVVADGSRAEVILRVDLQDIDGRGIVRDATPVREGSFDFRAIATLHQRASGRLLRRREVLDRAEFRVPVGESRTSAIDEAVSDLARKIVLALEGPF